MNSPLDSGTLARATLLQAARLPDDAIADDGAATFQSDPNTTWTRSPAAFHTMIREFVLTEFDTEPAGWENSVTHEMQHAVAARAAGYTDIRYGLSVWRNHPATGLTMWQPRMACHVPQRPVTKLALASVYAAPDTPSDTDLETLRAAGYDGIADVAARIAARNRETTTRPLVMPPSCHRIRARRPRSKRSLPC